MATFETELLECFELVLGERPPAPDYDALRFFRHWLAERNLGLVPVADAPAFDWPGHWIARVHVAEGDHAVVMFGSPSGALHDPASALVRGGTIAEGWVIAGLDVRLPIERGDDPLLAGTVEGILIAPDAEAVLTPVDAVDAHAGRGLEGDRYFHGRGTFTAPGRGYELTLVEAEVLESLGLDWAQARRNIVTRGVSLNALVGRRFTIGSVECVGRRLAEPCAHLERLSGPDFLRPLVHRAGLRADIVRSGPISLGDRVEALD